MHIFHSCIPPFAPFGKGGFALSGGPVVRFSFFRLFSSVDCFLGTLLFFSVRLRNPCGLRIRSAPSPFRPFGEGLRRHSFRIPVRRRVSFRTAPFGPVSGTSSLLFRPPFQWRNAIGVGAKWMPTPESGQSAVKVACGRFLDCQNGMNTVRRGCVRPRSAGDFWSADAQFFAECCYLCK